MSGLGLILPPAHVAQRWRSGRYYDWQTAIAGTIGTVAPASANLIYATPIYNPAPCPIDQLGIEVTTTGSALAQYGVYLDTDNDGLPDTLLVSGSEADLSSGTTKTSAVSAIVPEGIVFGSIVFSATLATMRGAGAAYVNLYGHTALNETTVKPTITASYAYAALPATFPAVTGNDARVFRVALRAA